MVDTKKAVKKILGLKTVDAYMEDESMAHKDYGKKAKTVGLSTKDGKTIKKIAADEERHYKFWKGYKARTRK